jgi:hypothetical protein
MIGRRTDSDPPPPESAAALASLRDEFVRLEQASLECKLAGDFRLNPTYYPPGFADIANQAIPSAIT